MKKSDLAQYLLDLDNNIDKIVDVLRSDLIAKFETKEKNNEAATHLFEVHIAMIDYVIASRINSLWKKSYDGSKIQLDEATHRVLGTSDGIPGETITLHRSNTLKFTKRQNKDSEAVTVTDLLNALARAGVEKGVVGKAYKMALKPKRGNTYYNVTAVED
ncbi:hypothetical protein LCGC14_1576600 [marine sediment metagenome]|uniref:Uncharacterized protein n=1 Tax=marine sediment metagenome TaxID=412755 RepID=A0A0F9II29_9ZZZZ